MSKTFYKIENAKHRESIPNLKLLHWKSFFYFFGILLCDQLLLLGLGAGRRSSGIRLVCLGRTHSGCHIVGVDIVIASIRHPHCCAI